MEHKCMLLSATSVGKHPLELMLHTVYVPPGQDGECLGHGFYLDRAPGVFVSLSILHLFN